MIRDQHLLPKLIALFQKHGGYWDINQSEDYNLEISWNPFISKAGSRVMTDRIFCKRVYCIQDFYNAIIVLLADEGFLEEFLK